MTKPKQTWFGHFGELGFGLLNSLRLYRIHLKEVMKVDVLELMLFHSQNTLSVMPWLNWVANFHLSSWLQSESPKSKNWRSRVLVAAKVPTNRSNSL